jgi:hypothetical protein
MSGLVEKLDKIANSLESKGLLKEAVEIDTLANTLEAFEKEAWNAKGSKQGKFLTDALNAAQSGNIPEAKKLLKVGDGMRNVLVTSYPTDQNVTGFSKSWIQAQQQLEQNNAQEAISSINTSFNFLQAAETTINAAQQPNGTPVRQEQIFPAKGVAPGAALARRAPIQPPARAMR